MSGQIDGCPEGDAAALHPLNRVRAIFIGYGDAGKTSLVRALHGEPVRAGSEPMTPGISIREWPVDGTDIVAHFWDFGGQVMAHATHQLLLRSSCLYVLVLSARSEINDTEQAEYWLEHVKAFGGSAPVMLVGNKADQASLHLDMGSLKEKYPNIVGYFPLSCNLATSTFQHQFNTFRDELRAQLALVGTHQMLFTQAQHHVMQTLREQAKQAAFVGLREFDALCQQHGIGTEGTQNRAWLLDILDKLGIVVHFPQLAFLEELVINPRWLTYGIYTLMYARKARLSELDAVQILGGSRLADEDGNSLDYPRHKCGFILAAMEQFKLCFPLPHDRNTRIIPALLPADLPEFDFDKRTGLAFEFAFKGFLPRHVMPEMIVNRHEEIVDGVVWQHGALLRHRGGDAQALLQVDYHLRTLGIWVQGADARDYLAILQDEILKILGRLDLEYTELIGLPPAAIVGMRHLAFTPEKASYRQIIGVARAGQLSFFSGSGTQYDLRKVLNHIMPDAEQVKAGVQIFNGNVIFGTSQNLHLGNPLTRGASLEGIHDIPAAKPLLIGSGLSGNEQKAVFNENITCHFTSLEIESYKSLRGLKLQKISKINLIAGVNNSGKTSLLEAVYLLARQNNFGGILDVVRRRGKIAENQLYSSMFVEQLPGDIEISGEFDRQNASVSLREYIEEGGEMDKSRYLKSVEIKSSFGKNNHFSRNHLHDGREHKTTADVFRVLCPVVYSCPFFMNEPKRYIEFYENSVREQALPHIEEFIRAEIVPSLRDIRLVDGSGRFVVGDSRFGRAMDITSYGEGLQRIFFISLLFASAKNGVVLIDEFENAIHAYLVPKFAVFLHRLASLFNVQVFLTSHSKECIDAFIENVPDVNDCACFALVSDEGDISVREFAGRKFHILLNAGDVDLRMAI